MTATQRMNMWKHVPDVHQAMLGLHEAAKQGVDPVLTELVLTRASQINRCAFCIDMHVKDARKAGETEERIYFLNAFDEVEDVYTEKERAALALTEAITVLTDGFVPDDVYQRAAKQFEEPELARLIALITTINAWNRMSVATRTPPAGR
ncbi:carboxymuconolactone decarboxylase family protein [Streptomyces sp. ACA25]|uniref:carboxymuconolactone decarboxylase family protein n=1 Tax=Streptomyces sp. ACA25 TaxID=3022596 RepID=UPI002307AB7D|nr:carboxymuconolactone decarboxylase family protein [Streptomyces sp. ACA25]MDB1086784.1 carboxymuconolactone decarboxylase family protein [Streptomyces sp. ACA25]